MGISGKNLTKSTSISGDMCSLDKTDGSQSDTAVGALGTSGKKRRSSIGAKMVAIVGLSRKSRSASQLSQTEEVDSTRRRHAGAMDIEERNRQMKINKYKQVAGSDPRLEQDYHSKYRSGWDPHRGADNISTKSSDSDVSDISAVSRTSSASRFSAERPWPVSARRARSQAVGQSRGGRGSVSTAARACPVWAKMRARRRPWASGDVAVPPGLGAAA